MCGRFVDCLDTHIISFTDVKYTANVAKATRHHQKTPFSTKEEIRRGGIKK